MSRQGISGVTFEADPLIATGAGKSRRNIAVATLSLRTITVADTKEVMSGHSPDYIVPDNSGEILAISSTAAGDTGIQVLVEGLDQNFERISELITLQGTTPIDLAVPWTRVNELTVTDTQQPVGTISIAGNFVYATIPVGLNRSALGIISAPARHSMQVLSVIGTMIRTQGNSDETGIIDISYSLIQKNEQDQWVNFVKVEAFSFGLQRRGNSISTIPILLPIGVKGPMDLIIEAESSATGTELACRLEVLLEQL